MQASATLGYRWALCRWAACSSETPGRVAAQAGQTASSGCRIVDVGGRTIQVATEGIKDTVDS